MSLRDHAQLCCTINTYLTGNPAKFCLIIFVRTGNSETIRNTFLNVVVKHRASRLNFNLSFCQDAFYNIISLAFTASSCLGIASNNMLSSLTNRQDSRSYLYNLQYLRSIINLGEKYLALIIPSIMYYIISFSLTSMWCVVFTSVV